MRRPNAYTNLLINETNQSTQAHHSQANHHQLACWANRRGSLSYLYGRHCLFIIKIDLLNLRLTEFCPVSNADWVQVHRFSHISSHTWLSPDRHICQHFCHGSSCNIPWYVPKCLNSFTDLTDSKAPQRLTCMACSPCRSVVYTQ